MTDTKYVHRIFEEFKKKLFRRDKDEKWDRDVKAYNFWNHLYERYGHLPAKQRMEEIQAEWPGKPLG